jgi:hypothetical protein
LVGVFYLKKQKLTRKKNRLQGLYKNSLTGGVLRKESYGRRLRGLKILINPAITTASGRITYPTINATHPTQSGKFVIFSSF